MKTILFLILALLLIPMSQQVQACKCEKDAPPIDAAAKADVVFIGKVVMGELMPDGDLRYKFTVEEKFKGILENTIEIYGQGYSTCGYIFQLGHSYLVYAYGSLTHLSTSKCSRTKYTSKFPEYINEIEELKSMKP